MNKKKVIILGPRGQYNHLIYRRVNELDYEAYLYDFYEDVQIEGDAVIIGGGPARLEKNSYEVKKVKEIVDRLNKPILGICLGFQILSLIFNGELTTAKPNFGPKKIYIKKYDEIFEGMPKEFTAWESHNDTLSKIPKDFEVLAISKDKNSEVIEVIKHINKPFYGVQFHPEVDHTEFGKLILKNFLKFHV